MRHRSVGPNPIRREWRPRLERLQAALRQDLAGEVGDLALTKLAAAGRELGEGRTILQSEVLNEIIQAGR
jgi:hypothetical protein